MKISTRAKQMNLRAKDVILRVLDSLLCVGALPIGVFLITSEDDNPLTWRLMLAGLFLTLCLSLVCQVLRRKMFDKPYKAQLFRAGVYLVCMILTLALPGADQTFPITSVLIAVVMILNRIQSIVRTHNFRNILINVACILLIGVLVFPEPDDFSNIFLIMMLINLGHILTLSFSGMNMRVLMKVIRKTYATDILAGLLLLMIAFSFVFPVLEDNITNFWDALWYCFAVVTTIGFGDFAAVTDVGRVMSVLLGIYGIIVVALVTSIVVNFYSEIKSQPDDEEEPALDLNLDGATEPEE